MSLPGRQSKWNAAAAELLRKPTRSPATALPRSQLFFFRIFDETFRIFIPSFNLACIYIVSMEYTGIRRSENGSLLGPPSRDTGYPTGWSSYILKNESVLIFLMFRSSESFFSGNKLPTLTGKKLLKLLQKNTRTFDNDA